MKLKFSLEQGQKNWKFWQGSNGELEIYCKNLEAQGKFWKAEAHQEEYL